MKQEVVILGGQTIDMVCEVLWPKICCRQVKSQEVGDQVIGRGPAGEVRLNIFGTLKHFYDHLKGICPRERGNAWSGSLCSGMYSSEYSINKCEKQGGNCMP